MARRENRGQAGFIITLELILIFTILGLGLIAGIVAVRNALFKFFLHQKASHVYVIDTDTPQKIIARAFDFDDFEAPRIQLADRGPTGTGVTFGGVTVNRRVLLGVRDDRFTSEHRIFYENSFDCGVLTTGGAACTLATCQACIVSFGNEDGDNLGVGKAVIDIVDTGGDTVSGLGPIANAGGIGYIYALQAGPAYGIGRDLDDASGLPGTLYRETAPSCDPAIVRSKWTSQEVRSDLPCEALPAGATVAAAKCPPGADGNNAAGQPCNPGPNVDPLCRVSDICSGGDSTGSPCVGNSDCNGNAFCAAAGQSFSQARACCTGLGTGTCNNVGNTCDLAADEICGCPEWGDASLADNWIAFGSNCCPPGTTEGAPGQCVIGNTGILREATPVVLANTATRALSIYVPPFRINFPVTIDATFQARAPGAFEGAPPGAVLSDDIEVDTIQFAPPANDEAGPP
jgi:hypothetical protein